MSSNKRYGLILPEKSKPLQPVFQASRNVFGDESDDESNKAPVLLRPSDNTNRQAKVTQEKAILEDPTVYQYDEIYDSMTSKKEETKVKSKEEKKPRYIENLMKAAARRKIDNDRRIERQIQKERENEGDEFADKEVFVTSAYKKKLEEMNAQEEKEKREEYLESIGDVTKQKDLGGFYRHLYEQKLGSDKKTDTEGKQDIQESHKNNKLNETGIDEAEVKDKKRNYRKRQGTDNKRNLSEGEIEESDEEINRFTLEHIRKAKKYKKDGENIDADSDFSIDESSDDDRSSEKADKEKVTSEKRVAVAADHKSEEHKVSETKKEHGHTEKDKIPVESKPKIDIWKKRTVGDVFEQALKRYYERKASRGG